MMRRSALDAKQCESLRDKSRLGWKSAEMAAEFGVSRWTVNRVLRGDYEPRSIGEPRTWPDTFWRRVDRGAPSECWQWTGGKTRFGHGEAKHGGRTQLAHRVAFEMENGAIPDDGVVRHVCDNPPCCNPS